MDWNKPQSFNKQTYLTKELGVLLQYLLLYRTKIKLTVNQFALLGTIQQQALHSHYSNLGHHLHQKQRFPCGWSDWNSQQQFRFYQKNQRTWKKLKKKRDWKKTEDYKIIPQNERDFFFRCSNNWHFHCCNLFLDLKYKNCKIFFAEFLRHCLCRNNTCATPLSIL